MAYDEQPIPADIKALLQRALAQRPEERFASAVDFKKELDKLLYGGAYSPTTFNLALFMDRLFRSEVEAEGRERGVEATVSVEPYLPKPEPPPPPAVEREFEFAAPEPAEARGKGMWIGIAAGVVVIGLVVGFLLMRGGSSTPAQPAQSQQDIDAKNAADSAKIKEMVERELARLMAEKEKEIVSELTKRQGKIDELQRKLTDLQQGASPGAETAEAKRSREDLERQIAAEKAAKVEQERKLESERQRALEEAKRKAQAAAAAAAAQREPTTATVAAGPTPSTLGATARPTAALPEATQVAALEPTPAPVTETGRAPLPAVTTVTENMFIDPSQVDTLPASLKETEVNWPRAALYSRRRGVIILQATVNSSGRVEEVKVLRADHDGFGIPEAAKEAVQKYAFKPGTKNGINVKTYATVTIPYRFQTR